LPGILERYEYKGSKHYTLLGVKEKIFSGPERPAAPCGLSQAARGLSLHRLSNIIKKMKIFYLFVLGTIL